MKEGRRAGGITAGPESKVLEGLTWEEARNLQEAQRVYVGDNVDFKVGAASKGIIQRDFQHHATVFRFCFWVLLCIGLKWRQALNRIWIEDFTTVLCYPVIVST